MKNVSANDTSGLVKRTDYYPKIKDIEDKIPSLNNLATTAGFFNF